MMGAYLGGVKMSQSAAELVITSYSIHYTKLYEDRGLAASRERSRALILAGRVLVGDKVIDKAGANVAPDSEVRLKGEDIPYVSRGGLKLEKALLCFDLDVRDRVVIDVGASTGGFTDCLLQHRNNFV